MNGRETDHRKTTMENNLTDYGIGMDGELLWTGARSLRIRALEGPRIDASYLVVGREGVEIERLGSVKTIRVFFGLRSLYGAIDCPLRSYPTLC